MNSWTLSRHRLSYLDLALQTFLRFEVAPSLENKVPICSILLKKGLKGNPSQSRSVLYMALNSDEDEKNKQPVALTEMFRERRGYL